MGNTTIQKQGSAAIVLHGTSGTGKAIIDDNSCPKVANLTDMPLYGMNSDQTPVFDQGGATKTIQLSGQYIDTSAANCKAWVESIEALVNGQQDLGNGYPLIFTDDMRGTLYVKISRFESTWPPAAPYIVLWTLSLMQSSTTA
jgi:hypothetical protein